MSRLAAIGLALVPAAVLAGAAGVAPAQEPGADITLPSGAVVRWLETRHDNAGGLGLTYRFRFIMPDLAQRVPTTAGPASDFAPDEARGSIEIDTESGEAWGEQADDGLIDPATLAEPAEADIPEPADEEAADALVGAPVLPAAPDVLAQDPVHEDIVWLCENWALPRIAAPPAPRPSKITINLTDRESVFGAFDPEAVQVFEGFSLPSDRDACEWEPW
ncbi:DUF6497 family protein [Paracoccus sp. P2]|uniref:Uncharacterized protein n=1 Tax=Paracoccus pantotrophus TaxID=82367 RepID=A0A7H9BQB0_PARPN|nr:DUF6497 family protein [Paracoccus pantotrophus]MDF3854041.1 DUF6497 family protein [Paracoccus pantotrophus]QLH13233.1 hypothetical protein HYQ43_02765 [Paracoccus pantotrophus]RDD97567.1 hypothetical protein DTW92_07820 [Paracoccus pantotrophus]RNI16860.1 hypothetical protein EB844_13430 [Paracoccus pantotrophus]WGR66808.1 hypothetical protein E3U24_16165 [Paracoccus pantotrophus]